MLARPYYLRNRPERAMDPLSDVLSLPKPRSYRRRFTGRGPTDALGPQSPPLNIHRAL